MHPYTRVRARPGCGPLPNQLNIYQTQLQPVWDNLSVNDIDETVNPEVNLSNTYDLDLASFGVLPRAADGPFDHPLPLPVTQSSSNNNATRVYEYPQANAYQQADGYPQAAACGEASQAAANGYESSMGRGYVDPLTATAPYDTPPLTATTSPASSAFPLTPSRGSSASPALAEKNGQALPLDIRDGIDYRTLLAYAHYDPQFQDWLVAMAAQVQEQRARASGNSSGTPPYNTQENKGPGFTGGVYPHGGVPFSSTMQDAYNWQAETEYQGLYHYTNPGTTQVNYQDPMHGGWLNQNPTSVASVAVDVVSTNTAQVEGVTLNPYQPAPSLMAVFDDTGYSPASMPPMQMSSTYPVPPVAAMHNVEGPHNWVAQQAAQTANSIKPTDVGTGTTLLPQVAQQLLPNELAGPSNWQTATSIQRQGRKDHKPKSSPYDKTNSSVFKYMTDAGESKTSAGRVACPAQGCTGTFGRPHEMRQHVVCNKRTRNDPAHIQLRNSAEWQKYKHKESLKTDLKCETCGHVYARKSILVRHKKTCK